MSGQEGTASETPLGINAGASGRDALLAMLAEGAVGVSGVGLDKYGGRVVADARTRSVANVSAELLERGYARRYAGGHRDGWCDGSP
jgi:endonuclease YncB( thermonuclease family)